MKKVRLQDFLIITSVFVLTTVLVLGLYPKNNQYGNESSIFFINTLMVVPVIIAVYYIVISFRKKIDEDYKSVDFSIQTKVAMAFMIIAVLPTLPIILFSNIIINKTLNNFVAEETELALRDAITVSEKRIGAITDNINHELYWYSYSINNGIFNLNSSKDVEQIRQILETKGYLYRLYGIGSISDKKNILSKTLADSGEFKYSAEIEKFLKNSFLPKKSDVHRIKIKDDEVITGIYRNDKYISIITRYIPNSFLEGKLKTEKALELYIEQEKRIPYLQSIAGIMLLIVTILIIVFAVLISVIVSKSITRPIMNLIDAAYDVGEGNFNVRLKRDSQDELTLLYKSFNSMVIELKEKRKILLQMEKLKAWNDVGAKLLHEIKNPLTPIKLSAERIRNRYNNGADNIDTVINSGTETIIEEVNSLQYILSEFRNYARLPEPKLEKYDISKVIDHCVKLFDTEKNIKFETSYEKNLPEIKIDNQLIKRAIINIIKNAVEALDGSGIISVSLRNNSNKNIIISIKDNGPGIPDEDIKKLFEPTFSKKSDGTGLGLAIVERIITQHGGKTYCNSDKNGTAFIILLQV